jgi:hypothetical protein
MRHPKIGEYKMKKLLVSIALLMIASGTAFSISKSKIPTNSANTSNLTIDKEQKNVAGKVRIGLKLSPFSKIQLQNQSGKNIVKFKVDSEIKRTLRARIDKPNHFIVDNYHVETIPLKWIKKSQNYTVRLSFSKRYGAYGEVEEHLGNVDVSGRLQGKGGVFVLMGASSKVIKNDRGEPLLKVVAGYGNIAPRNTNVSKKKGQEKAQITNKKRKKYSTFKPRRTSNKAYVR